MTSKGSQQGGGGSHQTVDCYEKQRCEGFVELKREILLHKSMHPTSNHEFQHDRAPKHGHSLKRDRVPIPDPHSIHL